MRALRYYATKDLRVDKDVPEPKCGPSQIKVKPAFVGICGTDLHEYFHPTFVPQLGSPHPVTCEVVPVGVGHEFSGTVLEIGSSAENKQGLKEGDTVAVQPTICCWTCGPCQQGYINSCDKAGFVGLSGGGGGMSEAVCIDDGFVFKLPDSIPLDIGALVEPLAVAWHAVDQYDIQEGDSALVLGAGPIGLGVVQCLKARGVETVIVVEVAKQRQEYAEHFGATHILDPTKDDVVKKCKEICNGQGPNVALDCAGVPASIKTAALSVRARGTVVNVAIWEKEVPFQPNWFVFGEKIFKAGKHNDSYTSSESADILSTGIPAKGLCRCHQSTQRRKAEACENDYKQD